MRVYMMKCTKMVSMLDMKKLDWLRKRPYTLLFLDGAHENYDLLAQYPVEERFGGRVQALCSTVKDSRSETTTRSARYPGAMLSCWFINIP